MRKYFQPKIDVTELRLRDIILESEPDTSLDHGEGGGGGKLHTPARLYV